MNRNMWLLCATMLVLSPVLLYAQFFDHSWWVTDGSGDRPVRCDGSIEIVSLDFVGYYPYPDMLKATIYYYRSGRWEPLAIYGLNVNGDGSYFADYIHPHIANRQGKRIEAR